MAAPVSPQAAMARDDQFGRAERPRRVMHQHDVGRRARSSASRPARTEACRVAPPGTGGSSRRPLAAASIERAVVGMDDRLDRADLAVPGEQRQARPDHRLARQLRGIAWANRRRRESRVRLRRPRRRHEGPIQFRPISTIRPSALARSPGAAKGFPPARSYVAMQHLRCRNNWLNSMQMSRRLNIGRRESSSRRRQRHRGNPLLHRRRCSARIA